MPGTAGVGKPLSALAYEQFRVRDIRRVLSCLMLLIFFYFLFLTLLSLCKHILPWLVSIYLFRFSLSFFSPGYVCREGTVSP